MDNEHGINDKRITSVKSHFIKTRIFCDWGFASI